MNQAIWLRNSEKGRKFTWLKESKILCQINGLHLLTLYPPEAGEETHESLAVDVAVGSYAAIGLAGIEH